MSMEKCTFIDGIASSQALDTSGEIVDLKGLDISSLQGAAINWEHKKDVPDQIVGKIVEVKKIFGKEDCENPRHVHFWGKIQLPFLYIKARLFDDKKPSSVEVAALFKDDAEHPNEEDMLGFSVEGSKIEKQGAVITRSIARVVTLAHMPANKTCIAEMAPPKDAKIDPSDVSELFKGEMQLFSFEPTYIQILDKKEQLKKDVGTGGGAFIGSQLAMAEKLKKDATVAPDSAKPVSGGPTTPSTPPPVTAQGISAGFTSAMGMGGIHKAEYDELEKSGWSKPSINGNSMTQSHASHGELKVSKNPVGKFDIHHNDKLVGTTNDAGKAGGFARKYASGLGKMEKALTAGSMNAAPGQLVGGAALGKEDLGKKIQKTSMQKKEKSKWYGRADDAYKTWDKREKFREYMKKRMPHLAEGEIDAIGKVLALKKNIQAEKNLSKMYASHFIKSSSMKKQASGTDIMMASEKKNKE